MIKINSIDYLKNVYGCLTGIKNQGLFIVEFFVTAGSNSYHWPTRERDKKIEVLRGPQHFIKDRCLTPDIKDSFPSPIKKKELTDYLLAHFNQNKIRSAMDCFGIPAEVTENNSAFAAALVAQFDAFVTSTDDNIDCIVFSEYQKFIQLSPEEVEQIQSAPRTRYNNDMFYMSPHSNKNHHVLACYQEEIHVWNIQNYGRKTWTGRKLVLVNRDELRPRFIPEVIDIPETVPGGLASVSTTISSRGFEGEFTARWEMQDTDGINCFATIPSAFNITIEVHYTNKSEEKQ